MTTTNSLGTSYATGLGSGLDIDSLVTDLVTAQTSAATSRIERQQTDHDTQVSALASLKSALATFQSSLSVLTSGTGFSALNASSSDEDMFTVEVDDTAATGSYSVVVSQLAQAHQVLSGAFTDTDTTDIGSGTLSFTVGDNSFSVTISDSSSTLQEIADAINYASSNAYVSATIINGTSGPQLLLTSLDEGADNDITVSVSDATGDLGDFAYSSSDAGSYTEVQAAQDSIIYVAGVEYQSDSNEVTGVLDGVTLNLLDADPDTTLTLKISKDTSTMQDLISSFVDSYNTLVTSLSSLDSYDSSTGDTGAMFGDALLVGIRRQLRNALNETVSDITGTYNSLSSLGITTDSDGYLTLDDTTLAVALSANFSNVSDIFDSDDGLLSRLDTILSGTLDTDGSLDTRSSVLEDLQTKIDDDQTALDARQSVLYTRYYAKYNAMDTLLAELQNTSDYLTSIFDSLNNSSSG